MKIFTVRVNASLGEDTISGVHVGGVTLEGVRETCAHAAYNVGLYAAEKLYGWSGPGMNISVIQTGEENRR